MEQRTLKVGAGIVAAIVIIVGMVFLLNGKLRSSTAPAEDSSPAGHEFPAQAGPGAAGSGPEQADICDHSEKSTMDQKVYVFRASDDPKACELAGRAGIPDCSHVHANSETTILARLAFKAPAPDCSKLVRLQISIDAQYDAMTKNDEPVIKLEIEGEDESLKISTADLQPKNRAEDPPRVVTLHGVWVLPKRLQSQPQLQVILRAPSAGDFGLYLKNFTVNAEYAK